jgi:hypothetical protein
MTAEGTPGATHGNTRAPAQRSPAELMHKRTRCMPWHILLSLQEQPTLVEGQQQSVYLGQVCIAPRSDGDSSEQCSRLTPSSAYLAIAAMNLVLAA